MRAWYVKNVPWPERVVRVVLGLGGGLAAVLTLPGWWGGALGLGVASFALTGLVGYCPACAAFGRKPLA